MAKRYFTLLNEKSNYSPKTASAEDLNPRRRAGIWYYMKIGQSHFIRQYGKWLGNSWLLSIRQFERVNAYKFFNENKNKNKMKCYTEQFLVISISQLEKSTLIKQYRFMPRRK